MSKWVLVAFFFSSGISGLGETVIVIDSNVNNSTAKMRRTRRRTPLKSSGKKRMPAIKKVTAMPPNKAQNTILNKMMKITGQGRVGQGRVMQTSKQIKAQLKANGMVKVSSEIQNSEMSFSDEMLRTLPSSVLAFPDFTRGYESKILPMSGDYQILTEKEILADALSAGLWANPDSKLNGSAYFKRGAVFYAPGLFFKLKAPKVSHRGDRRSNFGWELVLDMVFLKNGNFQENTNYVQYSILIDGVKFRDFAVGYSRSYESPIVIAIPIIRDPNKNVSVAIELANQRGNYGILYDAVLRTREN